MGAADGFAAEDAAANEPGEAGDAVEVEDGFEFETGFFEAGGEMFAGVAAEVAEYLVDAGLALGELNGDLGFKAEAFAADRDGLQQE